MQQKTLILVMASADLPLDNLPEAVTRVSLGRWLESEAKVWVGAFPVCILVGPDDREAFFRHGLAAEFLQQNVPIIEVGGAEIKTGLLPLVFGHALNALGATRAAAHDGRTELAALRRDYMQLQQNFGAVEDFLYNAFAPQFMCVRAWAPVEASVASGTIRQRLPVGSTGLVAVDIWAMAAGKASLRFCRETGEDFGPEIKLEATGPGWVRAMLERPLAGLAEDVVLEISSDFALGLSLPTPLKALHAASGAPLALQVWKGLPDVRLPEMESQTERHIIPASSLPTPEVLGSGSAKPLRGRDAISLHPGHDGQLDLVFRGVDISAAANIAVFVQNFGPDTVSISLAPGKDAKARSIYLQPETHGQCDLDIPSPGKVDLYLSLSAPSPMVSVYIRGLEICPMAG